MAVKKKGGAPAAKVISPAELARQARLERQKARKARKAQPTPKKTPDGMTTTAWKKLRKAGKEKGNVSD